MVSKNKIIDALSGLNLHVNSVRNRKMIVQTEKKNPFIIKSQSKK